MMAAGLIGTPGFRYFEDRYSAETLHRELPALYTQTQAADINGFLLFAPVRPVDGKILAQAIATPPERRSEAQFSLVAARMTGHRRTLAVDALIPA
jgi:hypothetical protein